MAQDGRERFDGIIAIDPNTGDWEKVGEFGHRFQISPDGTRFLYCTGHSDAGANIWVTDAKRGTPMRIVDDAICPHWSPDGKQVLYFKGKKVENPGWSGPTWVYELETKQAKKLPVPETDEVDDWSREGNWLVTVADRDPREYGYQLYIMHPDGSNERRMTEGGQNCYPKFSHDGKRLVYYRSMKKVASLWVVDIDGSNRKQVIIEDDNGSGSPDKACWSPDGKWLAVQVQDWQTTVTSDGKLEKFSSPGSDNRRIEIVTPDGTKRHALRLFGVHKVNWIEDPEWH